jgi:hypothetical protein
MVPVDRIGVTVDRVFRLADRVDRVRSDRA